MLLLYAIKSVPDGTNVEFHIWCALHAFFFYSVHCKNCGVLCPPKEQHNIGVISHLPLNVCLAHVAHHNPPYLVCKVWNTIGMLSYIMVECVLNTVFGVLG